MALVKLQEICVCHQVNVCIEAGSKGMPTQMNTFGSGTQEANVLCKHKHANTNTQCLAKGYKHT